MTRVAGGTVTQTEQNRECSAYDSYTETAKPRFGKRENFVFDFRRFKNL
jgi:hypothetical protein